MLSSLFFPEEMLVNAVVAVINNPASVLPSGSVTLCLSVTPKLSKLQLKEKNNHGWSAAIRSDRFSFISSYLLLISL